MAVAKSIANPITDQLTLKTPHLTIDMPGQKDAGGSAQSGGAAASAATTVSAESRKEQLLSAYNEMYDVFSPGELTYEAQSEEEIRSSVASWLRPAYEQAMKNRTQQTGTYGAELDADAVARGMGASTYVTDVKSRQQTQEAEDIAMLESEYGAALAKAVSERLESEKDRMLEVEMYNRSQSLDVSEMAYGAAQGLVGVGGSAARGGGGRSGTRRSGYGGRGSSSTNTNTQETCAAFLSILDDDERLAIYAGSDAQSAAYRDEIVASVGLTGFYQLQKEYGVAP